MDLLVGIATVPERARGSIGEDDGRQTDAGLDPDHTVHSRGSVP